MTPTSAAHPPARHRARAAPDRSQLARDLPLLGGPCGWAELSPCGTYRYLLGRRVGAAQRGLLLVCLNPSTADASLDDPTIRRAVGFTRREGCAILEVAPTTGSSPRRSAGPPWWSWRGGWFTANLRGERGRSPPQSASSFPCLGTVGRSAWARRPTGRPATRCTCEATGRWSAGCHEPKPVRPNQPAGLAACPKPRWQCTAGRR